MLNSTVPDMKASVDRQYNSLINAIKESAKKSVMVFATLTKITATQPDFARECSVLKRKLNEGHKWFKSTGF